MNECVALAELLKLPKSSGIYIVMNGVECIYVGKSKNIYSRWNGGKHHRESQIINEYPEASIYWLLFDVELLSHWEDYYINTMKPKLNKTRVVIYKDNKPIGYIKTGLQHYLEVYESILVRVSWISKLSVRTMINSRRFYRKEVEEVANLLAMNSNSHLLKSANELFYKPVDSCRRLHPYVFDTIYIDHETHEYCLDYGY